MCGALPLVAQGAVVVVVVVVVAVVVVDAG